MRPIVLLMLLVAVIAYVVPIPANASVTACGPVVQACTPVVEVPAYAPIVEQRTRTILLVPVSVIVERPLAVALRERVANVGQRVVRVAKLPLVAGKTVVEKVRVIKKIRTHRIETTVQEGRANSPCCAPAACAPAAGP